MSDKEFRRDAFSGYLTFTPMLGQDIGDVLLRMKIISQKTTATIKCTFNGYDIFVDENTDIDKIIADKFHTR